MGRARETRVPSPTTRVSERLQLGFLSASERLKLCDVITRAPRSSSASRKAPASNPRSLYLLRKTDSSTGAVHMGGPPGNARAPGLTRLPSKVEYAGRSLGLIQSRKTLWAEHEHLKYSKPINSVFYSSCRPWVDRQDLASVRWGWSRPSIGRAPPTTARRTWLSFRPTESLHTCTSIRSLRVEKKNIDPPCMGSISTSSCPGVMPWDGSQGSHGSGRVRQFVNCLSHRNVRFF